MHSCAIVEGRARIKTLWLTPLGQAALGVQDAQADRLGGPEHRYRKQRIAEHLRSAGYEVVEEAPLGGGRTVDLLAVREGRRTAVETETGRSDARTNVRKCLEAGVDEVVVVVTSPRVRLSLGQDLQQDCRVVVCRAGELPDNPPPSTC